MNNKIQKPIILCYASRGSILILCTFQITHLTHLTNCTPFQFKIVYALSTMHILSLSLSLSLYIYIYIYIYIALSRSLSFILDLCTNTMNHLRNLSSLVFSLIFLLLNQVLYVIFSLYWRILNTLETFVRNLRLLYYLALDHIRCMHQS